MGNRDRFAINSYGEEELVYSEAYEDEYDELEDLILESELYCDPYEDCDDEDLWADIKAESEIPIDESEIEVGDVCIVKNSAFTYYTYAEFVAEAGHPDINTEKYVTLKTASIIEGRKVRVLYLKQNPYKTLASEPEMLAIVECIDFGVYLKFLLVTKGLAKLYSKEALVKDNLDLFFRKYLFGKELKESIPDVLVNERLLEAITIKNPIDIEFVNPNLLTDDHYKRILCRDGGLLGLIPEERRTLELCKLAISEEEYAVKFVPEGLKSLVRC